MANTFTSFCIMACVFMMFITLGISFVGTITDATGNPVFHTTVSTGDTPSEFSGLSWDWIFAIIGGSGVAIAFSYLTKTTNYLGVYIFGIVFWVGWGKLASILTSVGYLDSASAVALIGMITIGMGVMFIGAVIGMLSGSIWMR
jgi:hypothetical protein